jgi:anti-sigma factor RsiW
MDPRPDQPTGVSETTCQEFVELITDYFEGALTPRSRTLVEEHLVLCDWCVTYAEQMEATRGALRAMHEDGEPAGEPSAALLGALRSRREGRG